MCLPFLSSNVILLCKSVICFKAEMQHGLESTTNYIMLSNVFEKFREVGKSFKLQLKTY